MTSGQPTNPYERTQEAESREGYRRPGSAFDLRYRVSIRAFFSCSPFCALWDAWSGLPFCWAGTWEWT